MYNHHVIKSCQRGVWGQEGLIVGEIWGQGGGPAAGGFGVRGSQGGGGGGAPVHDHKDNKYSIRPSRLTAALGLLLWNFDQTRGAGPQDDNTRLYLV